MAPHPSPPSLPSHASSRPLTLLAAALLAVDLTHGLLTGRYGLPASALHVALISGVALMLLRGGGPVGQMLALTAAAAAQLPWGLLGGADLLAPGVLLPLASACVALVPLRLLMQGLDALVAPVVTLGARDTQAAASPGERPQPAANANGIAPGWYSDPLEPAWLRWWDGAQWTESRRRAAS